MSIELMRRIDYWIGIPLCFFLSLMHSISRLLTFRKKENSISPKFLFIKLSEMGSIILTYPLINKAQRDCPKAEIFFLTFKKNAPVLEILNIVPHQNILVIRDKSFSGLFLDTLKLILRLQKEKIDIVFDLEFFSRFTAILTYLSSASKRVGFYPYSVKGLYRGNFLTHKVQYNPRLHTSKLYLSLWRATRSKIKLTSELEEKIEDREILLSKFIPPEETKRQIWDKLKNHGIKQGGILLLFNPGEGAIPLREWPLENFITLAGRLLEDAKNHIIIVGTQTVFEKAELFVRSVDNERCLNLSDETSIPEVLSLCKIAKALITNDSGLAHLASLTPIKKFIFFGPESPHIFSPLGSNTWIMYSDLPCSPCFSAFNHRNSACKDNKCLRRINPDDVYELVKVHI